jgi:purine-nucleoside phosphorylase
MRAAMPARLRPTAPLAPQAILTGDPGRSLLLAQELLEQPKMSNHARGLWGYSGRTAAGGELTIQATGMGGPSAALVLADLAQLGVRRAVRVGTCVGCDGRVGPGELLLPREAVAIAGSAASFGLAPGATVTPDPVLLARLREELAGEARETAVASLDTLSATADAVPTGVVATDMQTVAVLARGGELGMATAAVLIVSEAGGEVLPDEALESAAIRAGRAAAAALSNPQVEG